MTTLHLYQILLILVPSSTTMVRSASWGRFFSRSLWTEPMDHFILEESPSHSHPAPAGIIQLTPIQFIPSKSSSGHSSQRSHHHHHHHHHSQSSSSHHHSQSSSSQRASSRIAPSEFALDSSDIYYTIANYSSISGPSISNSQSMSGQSSLESPSSSSSHSLDKTLLDLLMATNASMPLSSEKYFWISHSNPRPFDSVGKNIEENDSSHPMAGMNGMKNDVTSDEDEDNVPHTKVVSLCDKTLALLDWIGKDPATAHLSKCELFDLEKSPELAYTEAKKTGIPIQNVSFREMRDIINACRVLAESDTIPNGQFPLPSSISSTTSASDSYPGINQGTPSINSALTSSKTNGTKPTAPSVTSTTTSSADKSFLWNSWRGIFPGTKWCGLGDSAKNYFDLGKRRDVDVCCRAHDHCPIRLKALRMGYGLINLSLYTKSHCDCDEDFMRCLRQANSKSAERLGNFYFNIMKVQCIKEEKAFMCGKYIKNKDGKDECVRIEEDKNATKMVFSQPETTYR